MDKSLKTSISRQKLYERNYTRDSIEELDREDDNVDTSSRYKTIINILTQKYLEKVTLIRGDSNVKESSYICKIF